MSTSDGAVQVLPSYQDTHLPLRILQLAPRLTLTLGLGDEDLLAGIAGVLVRVGPVLERRPLVGVGVRLALHGELEQQAAVPGAVRWASLSASACQASSPICAAISPQGVYEV